MTARFPLRGGAVVPALKLHDTTLGDPATSGGTQPRSGQRPRALPLTDIDDRLAAPVDADANHLLYRWDASRDYDA